MDINHLLEDINIRHAEKYVDLYVINLEQTLGIKVDPGPGIHEYVYKAVFEFCSDARYKQKCILEFGKHQTIFSVEKCDRSLNNLCAKFKFHPENTL